GGAADPRATISSWAARPGLPQELLSFPSRAVGSAEARSEYRPAARMPATSEPLRTGGPPTRSSPSCSPSWEPRAPLPLPAGGRLMPRVREGHTGTVTVRRGRCPLEGHRHATDRQCADQLDILGRSLVDPMRGIRQ